VNGPVSHCEDGSDFAIRERDYSKNRRLLSGVFSRRANLAIVADRAIVVVSNDGLQWPTTIQRSLVDERMGFVE